MTNDSSLFRTGEQLQADGFYPVAGHRWRRGNETYVPLYEGKMLQAFDHRAASVVVNPENLNRPAQAEKPRQRNTLTRIGFLPPNSGLALTRPCGPRG